MSAIYVNLLNFIEGYEIFLSRSGSNVLFILQPNITIDLAKNLVYFADMAQVNIDEAKTNLSQLLSRAVLGEDILSAFEGSVD